MTPQEKLLSLHQSNLANGFEPLPDDPNDPLDPIPGIPLSGDLTLLDDDTLLFLFERVRRFKKRFPKGEWMYSSPGTFRFAIFASDLVELYYPKMSLRSAQRLMANIRVVYSKPPHGGVTVKEFCAYMNENEDDVRDFLKQLDKSRVDSSKSGFVVLGDPPTD